MEQNSEYSSPIHSVALKIVLLRVARYVAKILSSKAAANVFGAVLRTIGCCSYLSSTSIGKPKYSRTYSFSEK